jgi:hypothetical protein
MPSPPPPPLDDATAATVGASLAASRARSSKAGKRRTAAARPLPLAPARGAATVRHSASLLSASEASADAGAADALRAWLSRIAAHAPRGSRYAAHRAAVVRKALTLLEGKR